MSGLDGKSMKNYPRMMFLVWKTLKITVLKKSASLTANQPKVI